MKKFLNLLLLIMRVYQKTIELKKLEIMFLKKINDYYMLRYYRIIILIIIIYFVAFLPFILILFDSLCNNLSEVTKINNKLYQTAN